MKRRKGWWHWMVWMVAGMYGATWATGSMSAGGHLNAGGWVLAFVGGFILGVVGMFILAGIWDAYARSVYDFLTRKR